MKNLILKYFPQHRIYVEAFGGSAALLFSKRPSDVEVYNDIDSGLVNFFRVLQDKEKFEEFYRLINLTPFSRELFNEYRYNWNKEEDEVKRAWKWYAVACMSFGGRFGAGFGYGVSSSGRGMALCNSKYLGRLESLPKFHERIMRVIIEHDDFRKILDRYDTPDTLFYLDPPYVLEVRRGTIYNNELDASDHEELVDKVMKLKGMAILSGYNNSIYTRLEENGWKRIDTQKTCNVVGRTRATGLIGDGKVLEQQKRIESIWLSPNTLKAINIFEGCS